MADEIAGRLFIELLPDVDRKKFQATLDASTKSVVAEIQTNLVLAKGAEKKVVAEANTKLAKTKPKPKLGVELTVSTAQVREVVTEVNTKLAALKRPPRIKVGLDLPMSEVRRAVRDVNTKLKTAAKKPPRIKVQVDIDDKKLEMAREMQAIVKQTEVTLKANPISIPLDLDEKSIALVATKAAAAMAVVQGRIDAAWANREKTRELLMVNSMARAEGRIQALTNAGVNQKQLAEQRFQNQRVLISERAEAALRRNSNLTLRQLRNDLSSFDSTTKRMFSRLLFGFTAFNGAITGIFAGISAAAIYEFGKIEAAANKSASLFSSQILGGSRLTGEAFSKELISTNRTITEQLTATARDVAVSTKFNTEEIADGFRFLAGAGVNLEQSLASMDTVARLAQAGFMELGDTSDLVIQGFIAAGGDINQFGNQIQGLSDKLVFVANESAVTLEEVLKAFSNRAGASFKAAGQSADEALNVIRLFGQTGIKGLKAGEQSAILIREITRSAAIKAPDAWKKYGIEIANADGSARSFAKVLDDIARVAQKQTKGFKDPAALVKLFNEELQLTEKSSGGLRQLLPSIAQLQARGSSAFKELNRLQRESGGRLAAQTSAVTDTLSFQFEAFANNVSNVASLFATGAGKKITQFLKDINGEAGTSTSLFSKLSDEAEAFGSRFGSFIGGALNRLKGVEGQEFFGGIIKGFESTLSGVKGLFTAFRNEVFGEGSNKGFFSVVGTIFAELGRISEIVLPRIGYWLGVIVGYVRNNTSEVTNFLKIWAGMFAASQALRLFIVPLESVINNIKKLRGAIASVIALDFAGNLIGVTGNLNKVTTATKAATAATEGLAIAQAAAAASAGAGGFKAFSTKASVVTAGAEVARTRALPVMPANSVGMFAKIEAVILRISKIIPSVIRSVPLFAKIGVGIARFAGPIGVAIAVIDAAIGAVKGFRDEISKGGKSSNELAGSLKELKPAFDAIVKVVSVSGKVLGDILGLVRDIGTSIGRLIGGVFADFIIMIGDLVRAFKELFSGNFIEAAKAFGDVIANFIITPIKNAIAFLLDLVADFVGSLSSIPGIGKYAKEAETAIRGAADATRDFRLNLSEAAAVSNTAGGNISRSLGLGKTALDNVNRAATSATKRITVFGIQAIDSSNKTTIFKDRAKNLNTVLGIVANRSKNAAAYQKILSNSSTIASVNMSKLAGGKGKLDKLFTAVQNGSKQAAKRLLQLKQTSIILARDKAIEGYTKKLQDLTDQTLKAGAATSWLEKLKAAGRQLQAGAALAGIARASTTATEDLKAVKNEIDSVFSSSSDALNLTGGGGGEGGGSAASEAVTEVKTAAEKATEAVNKLSQAQLNQRSSALIKKVVAAAAKGYKATAVEAEILKRTLPSVEAQLEKQQAAVQKLDKALQDLQATQLKGTKAFSEQTFAIEQNVKQIQLQRLDLVMAGTPEEDPAIKALDEQIAKLQQQAERVSLVESLQLDPLKRKLEETFNPVKELSFDEIMKQFNAISVQKSPLEQAIAGGENLKALLESSIKEAEAKFTEAGMQVTVGLINGVNSQKAGVTKSGKDAGTSILQGVNSVMQFGSPSKTMIQRGVWVGQGFVQGVNSTNSLVMSAGATTMFSFLTGMRNVYTNRVQPFVTGIAKWIKDNKGPISYDATLLRPAGEAMMTGFHKGLKDGFGEVKGWVKQVGPDLARHTIPDRIFKKMSAEFLIGNATADLDFDPQDFFADIAPITGNIGLASGSIGQSTGLEDTINQAKLIGKMFGITPNIASEMLRYNNPGYNASIGGAAGSLHVAGRAMDYGLGGSNTFGELSSAANWARQYLGTFFDEVLWQTTDHYDHLHLGWKFGNKKLLPNIPGVPQDVLEAIAYASQQTKLSPALIAAVMKQESGFRKNVVSFDGGYGLMQLTSAGLVNKADRLGGRLNPKINALVGSEYLRDLINQLGSTKLGLSAYNSGPGGGERYGRIDVPDYVNSVMAMYEEYLRKLGGGNFRALGGKVNANTPYTVGERGRELFVPSQNGSVISNKDLRDLINVMKNNPQAATGGSVVNDNRNIVVNSNSTDPATVASLVDSRMRSQIMGVSR